MGTLNLFKKIVQKEAGSQISGFKGKVILQLTFIEIL